KNDNMLLPSRDPAICASCTDSRVIKGVSRSVVFYTARQIFFDSLDRVPILSNILSPFVLPLSIFMRGQDAFDFVLSEQYCERHVRVNLREYSELFLTFGLMHYAIVQLVLFAMMALKNVASKQLLYTLPEN